MTYRIPEKMSALSGSMFQKRGPKPNSAQGPQKSRASPANMSFKHTEELQGGRGECCEISVMI